jgi:hypothetical protein
MPRTKRPIPWVEIKHKMPVTLKLHLDQLLTPAHLTEPPQGARQALINKLLWSWITEHSTKRIRGDGDYDHNKIDD